MGKLKMSCIVAMFFAMQNMAAQNPAISTKYSDVQITDVVEKFRAADAHDVQSPADLQRKFQADFPKAYDVEWETVDGIYEVEFEIRFREFTAVYDAKGNLLMTVEEIRSAQLPDAVKKAAEAKYPKYVFEDVQKIRKGSQTVYKIEMERLFSDTEAEMLIKADGTVIEDKFEY